MKNNSDENNILYNKLLKDSMGVTMQDDIFDLPSDLDFMLDDYSIDLQNKVNNANKDIPMYIETPFSETPGYYNSEKVFIIKATPFIEGAVRKEFGEDEVKLRSAKLQEELNQDDGDTIYFMNSSISSGESGFSIGERFYESFEDFINAQHNTSGKFGVRFLGINTPEIPHYYSVPIKTDEIESFKYKDIKSSTNFTVLSYKISGSTAIARDDNDIIRFAKDEGSYREIIETDFYVGLGDEEISVLKTNGYTMAKAVLYDSSEKSTVTAGLDIGRTVREMIANADNMLIMLDHKTISSDSNNFVSPYKSDYFSYNYSVAAQPWRTVYNTWKNFFSEERYKLMGYNNFGQDNNKRTLGTIYLRTKVEELGDSEPVWINLSKYILQKYKDSVVSLPDYTSDPMKNLHGGFVSDAFKMWTYNFDNQVILNAFNTFSDEKSMIERNKILTEMTGFNDFEEMKKYTVVLGDNALVVPPTSIRMLSQANIKKVSLLRSRGGATKQVPKTERSIELKIFFNDESTINGVPYEATLPSGVKTTYYLNGLRGLIAQFKLTPFLPIENHYINSVLNIFAVSLKSLHVAPSDSYPRMLAASLILEEFDYNVYMPELPVPDVDKNEDLTTNMFSKSINYDAMRWYYQRLLQKGNDIKNLEFNSEEYIAKTFGTNTALVPMEFQHSKLDFYLPDKDWMDQRLAESMEKESRSIRPYYPLGENGKELIRLCAPFFENIKAAITEAEKNKIADKLFESYDSPTASKVFYDAVSRSKLNKREYNFKPMAIHSKKSKALSASFDNTSIRKADYPMVSGEDGIVKIVYSDSVNNGSGGSKIAADSLKDYFRPFIDSLSSYGNIEIIEDMAANKDSQIRISLLIPLPPVIMDQTEREEFKKLIITYLEVGSYDDIFRTNSSGRECAVIEFIMPCEKHDILTRNNVSGSSAYTEVLIPTKPFSLNHSSNGFRYIAYCDASVEKITIDGKVQYLDYVGNDKNNMTSELENLEQSNRIESASSIKFNKYDIGKDIILQQLNCYYENSTSKMSLNAIDGYAHQFCGGQDITIEASLSTTSEATVALLQAMPALASSYVIEYRTIMSQWPLRIDSDITRMFGVNEVLIESVDTSTVEKVPGLYTVKIRMMSVDRSTRNREALKKLEGINNSNPMNNDARSAYEMSSFFDLKRVLGKAEIYPDLELPTIDELEYAGYKMIGYDNGKEKTRTFVDPDFYFTYAHTLNSELFRNAIVTGFNSVGGDFKISDRLGASQKISSDKKEGMTATPLNEVAAEIDNKNKAAAQSKNVMDLYMAMNKKGFNDLKMKQKISSRLSQTISGLGTPIWDISDKYSFILREEQYKQFLKEEDAAYTSYIKNSETRMKEIIKEEVSGEVSLKKIGLNAFDIDSFPAKYVSSQKKMTLNTELRVKQFTDNFVKNSGFLFELIHSGGNEETKDTDMKNVKTILDKVMLAYADAQTGSSYCIQTSTLLNPLATDEDKKAIESWKVMPFLNAGENVITNSSGKVAKDNQKLDKEMFQKIQPYSRLISERTTFATNIDDAIINGRTFGAFQIQMYPKKAILGFVKDSEEKERIAKSDLQYMFIDPYYRKAQLDGDADTVRKYKLLLMIDPAYCAYAYMRNMMIWYNYLIDQKAVVSIYEAIKSETSKQYGKIRSSNTGKKEDAAGESGSFSKSALEKEESKNEEESKKVYEKIYKENLDIFALAYCISFDTKNDPSQLEAPMMAENGVPEEVREMLAKSTYKNATVNIVDTKIKTLLKELDNVDKDNSIEDKETEKEYIKIKLDILGYVRGGQDDFIKKEITKESALLFVTNTILSHNKSIENLVINEQTFAEIYKQLNKPNSDLIIGKVMGMSLLMMQNNGTILNDIENANIGALKSLMSSLPVVDALNSGLELERKYVLALDGRGVLEIETVGVRKQSAEELVKIAAREKVDIRRSDDVRAYLKDSYLDMIQNDKRGRMIRAFPTYYMIFIDEGRKIGLWRLHDNFYNMNAISSIDITKSRKIAADTAEITMSNMFKTFSSDDQQKDYTTGEINTARYNMRDAFNSIFSPRTYYMKEEYKRQLQELPRNAQLIPGIRMSIRMGFGANAADLPVVFNGAIAEVGTSDMVDIVAQGDGIELMNPINDIEDAADVANKEQFFIERWISNWLTNGATPREILLSLLMYRGTWLQTVIKESTKGRFFNYNPYGIVHFGDPEFKDIFIGGEVGQNIFEAHSRATYGDKEKFSGLEEKYMTEDTPTISINLLGKTFWDVMHICASAQPDFITSIVPFGLRSSVFYGAPRFYYAYDYKLEQLNNGGTMNVEKRKPFQQRHIYSSFTDIIHNNIKASSKVMKTSAIGLYQEQRIFSEATSQVGPLYVDFDIYDEYQRSMTVDTQLWAKGMPGIGNGFGWTADLSKTVSDQGLIPIPGAKEIAWRMTASALKNSVKDMYDGELTVMGDPTVKPYDRISISDIYERMQGECEVEAVVHSFNSETGFTTSIYADCISIVDDRNEQYAHHMNSKVVGYAMTALSANVAGYAFNKNGRPIISSMLKFANTPVAASASIINSLSSFLGANDLKIGEKLLKSHDVINAYAGGTGESSFLTSFKGTLNARSSYFSKLTVTDALTVNELDNFLHNLSSTLKEFDKNAMTNQLDDLLKDNKHISKEAVQKAMDEYLSLKGTAKIDIASITSLSDEAMTALGKLAQSDNIDELSKAVFTAASKDPAFLSNASNIESLRGAIKQTEKIDDVLDAVRELKPILAKSDDIAKVLGAATASIKGGSAISGIFGSLSTLVGISAVANIVLFAAEMIATMVIGSYVTEWIYRYLQNLQVLQIYPLKKKGRPLIAGLNGNKGVIVGSSTEHTQGEWTNFVTSLFDTTKKANGLATWTIQQMFVDEKIESVVRNLRSNNDLPEPYGSVDSNISKEEITKKIESEVAAIYSGNAAYNNRNIMWLEREGNFVNNEELLERNLFKLGNEGLSTPELIANTVPIQEDEEIKKYLAKDVNFFGIYHDKQIDYSQIVLKYSNKNISMGCLKSDSGAWNIPVLRMDSMILLKDALQILYDKFEISATEPDVKVYLTSATIIGGKSSWENTGLAFRLQIADQSFTEEDIKKVSLEIQDSYKKSGAVNFMQSNVNKDNKRELMLIVKPRVDTAGRER